MVDVGCWAVCVARESVKRKRKPNFWLEEGIMVLEHMRGAQYQALSCPLTPLSLSKTREMVLVRLDYKTGPVAFFDVKKIRLDL